MASRSSDMKNVIKIFTLCLLTAALGSGAAPGSSHARRFSETISGIVIDRDNQPVREAKVCAVGTGGLGNRPWCGQSNTNGHFSIEVDRPDTFTITAEAVAQGYPEAICSFYGKTFCNFPVVIVAGKNSINPVEIKLGPKAGKVTFTIFDEATRKPFEQGLITVCRVGEPFSCWSKSTAFPGGQYELLTPDAPFTVKFQTWKNGWMTRAAFEPSGAPVEMIQVELGAYKRMTVRLK
jgi:hypothetical protein